MVGDPAEPCDGSRMVRVASGPLLLAALLIPSLGGCEPPSIDLPPPPPPESGDPVDRELAEAGEQIFRRKGCLACHTVQGGGQAVGPTLAGVAERRSYEWYRAMVMNPDSMLRVDPVARELLAEYRVPMPYQRITEWEVRAVFEYLRQYR